MKPRCNATIIINVSDLKHAYFRVERDVSDDWGPIWAGLAKGADEGRTGQRSGYGADWPKGLIWGRLAQKTYTCEASQSR